MRPYELGQFYPEGGFDDEAAALAWVEWAAPHLDKRDYNRIEKRAKFVVVQDIRPA